MTSATDIWQVGIVERAIGDVLNDGLDGAEIIWLPEAGSFRFNADPFGLWHNGCLTVLVEAYDYRSKHGEIHYHTFDPDWNLTAQGVALREPFHLSYPQTIRDGGHIYLLPEGHRGDKLVLYRAVRFPDMWLPVATLLESPVIDASVVWHSGRWWMFHALAGEDQRAMRELHVAYADTLAGPWHPHAGNPVREALDSARPGGTPFVHRGVLYLPTQDCTRTYGGGLTLLRIEELTPDRFRASPVRQFMPDVHPLYRDGLHTLSAAGDVTLIDVKRLDRSSRLWIDLERRWRRLVRK